MLYIFNIFNIYNLAMKLNHWHNIGPRAPCNLDQYGMWRLAIITFGNILIFLVPIS